MTPPNVKGRTFPPEPLTDDEVRRLLAAASDRSASGVRMQALIAVLFGAGIRIGEALALYPRDVDLGEGTLRVRRGKGSKDRLVGLDPYASGLLGRWLDRRGSLGLNGRHPVFATYSEGHVGDHLEPAYVRAALRRLADRAGIDKRVHPHGLRHSMAFDLAQRRVPMHMIQRQLGHARLATTDRYVDHLRPTDVIDVMRSRDWSGD